METTDRISIDEFRRMDLRVGRVLEAARVEGTKKLLRVVVDIGEAKRTVVAGIADRYAPEALLGKRIILVANLKPAKIRGVESDGMILAADTGDAAFIATFEEEVAPGTKVR